MENQAPLVNPAAYLVRVAHSLGQLQYVPFLTREAAEAELARVAPDGNLDTPYGVATPAEFARFEAMYANWAEKEDPRALALVEVTAESLPVVPVGRLAPEPTAVPNPIYIPRS